MNYVFSVWLAVTLGAAGADWPQFRGPSGSGVSPDIDLPSNIRSNNLVWTADLPGRGLSSPIILSNRLFLTCSSGPKQDRLHIICFNVSDGSKRWERQFWATGRTMTHPKTCVAAPTPAGDGARLFAIFSSNDLICLDLDGNLQWLRGLTRDYPNASNSLGMSSSLLVADGVLIAMLENDSESFTAGVEVRTGTNIWKMDRPRMANWTSPVTVPTSQGVLVALQSGKGLVAVQPRTGKIVWDYTEGASTIPSSTVDDGVLYVPSFGLTALKPVEGEKPRQLWRSNQLRPATSSPTVVKEQIFTLNEAGVLTCGDTKDGKRLWQLRLKGPISATPVAAGSSLYCVNETGLLQVVDISGKEGVVVSEFALDKTILSTPSIAGGALYVRSDDKLWKFARNNRP